MSLIGFEDTVVLSTDLEECESLPSLRATLNEAPAFCGEEGTLIGYDKSTPKEEIHAEARELVGRDLDGRYVLTEIIGIGSSGVVYRAISTQIPRVFAVKVVKTDNGPGTRARFDNEVSALSRLNSPHIVQISDVVEVTGGRSALVMENIDGQSLQALVDSEGPLPIERVLVMARQIAAALAAVHGAGMTHSDVKPDNLIVERLPLGGDFVHLVDFDIVQFRGQVPAYEFAGTPKYASPEQARGERLDDTSDIYSFGAVLFTMLTGQPPFGGDIPRDLLRQHLNAPIPRLSQACPGRRFPSSLERLVARMLNKNPAARPQSLAEVISLIEQADAQLEHSQEMAA